MDYIFISQVLLIIFSYYLIHFIFKQTDWNFRGKKENWSNPKAQVLHNKLQNTFNIGLDDFLIGFYVLILGLPLGFSICVLLFSISKSFQFISERSYIEQIFFFIGLIVFYFTLLVKSENNKFKIKEKENVIKQYQTKIWNLENELLKNKSKE